MRSIFFVAALIISGHVLMSTSCNKSSQPNTNCDGVMCTAIFAMVSAHVVNTSGQPVTLDEAYTISTKTGEKIKLEQQMGNGMYNVMDDSYQKQLANRSDDFRFIGIKNGVKVVDEPYRISADCCHISKVSGKDTVMVP